MLTSSNHGTHMKILASGPGVAEMSAIPELRQTWLNFFVTNFRVVVLLIVVITTWGIYSFINLPRESNPEVKISIGVVSTVYPGASPSDVEEFVTKKIEAKLSVVSQGQVVWSDTFKEKTHVPLPKISAYQASRLAVSDHRSAEFERVLYENARENLRERLALSLRNLPSFRPNDGSSPDSG